MGFKSAIFVCAIWLVGIPLVVFMGINATADIVENGPPPRQIDHPKNLSGIYFCEGTIGKKKYEGAATIEKVKDLYIVHFLVAGNSVLGVGTVKGNMLAVGWAGKAVNERGVTVYQIQNGKLVGHWSAAPGDGGKHPETLTFLRELAEPKLGDEGD